MAYQTGSATSVSNLFSTIYTFATSNGWTGISGGWPITNGANCHVNWSGGTSTYSIRDYTNYGGAFQNKAAFHLTLGTSQPGTAPSNWYDMPGSLSTSNTDTDNIRVWDAGTPDASNGGGSFVAYHLFTDTATPRYLHVALQLSSQIWQHFSIGDIEKNGLTHNGIGYASGGYMVTWQSGTDGTSANNIMQGTNNRLMFGGTAGNDAFADPGVQLNITNPFPVGWSGNNSVLQNRVYCPWAPNFTDNGFTDNTTGSKMLHAWHRAQAIPISGVTPIFTLPCIVAEDTAANTEFVYLGDYPDIRLCRMDNLNPGDEFTFGGNTWKVFPYMRQTQLSLYGTAGEITSGPAGIAYKKVT